ncbi:MAG: NADPH-dependent F420 reductase [Proteobacteria bacterium]|nr:NADPH-dependent F420 reductase [Pseudomonadota bacterium]
MRLPGLGQDHLTRIKDMTISIVGAGNMAKGIASRFLAGGHSVTIVAREALRSRRLVEELAPLAHSSGASVLVADWNDPLKNEVVVLAMSYSGNLETARHLASGLAGKIVVEISNPLNETYDGLVTTPDMSAAEMIQAVLPESKVVKAFNTVFANTLLTGQVAGQPLDVLVAGNDDKAKSLVSGLIRSAGLIFIDVGPLHRARQLEAMALLGITLQGPLGLNFMSAWKLLH